MQLEQSTQLGKTMDERERRGPRMLPRGFVPADTHRLQIESHNQRDK